MDVFISYHTQSAGDAVEKICEALENAGISCWYAPRNVGANYAQSIVEAIRGCRVFLLVLNKESNLSAHVLNEVNCAFDRFRNHEDITLLPFRIDDCALSDDVYYYLGRIHIMDGACPPEIVRIQELVARVSVILGKEAERTAVLPAQGGPVSSGTDAASGEPGRTYRLTGSMVYPDSRFVGRGRELAEIGQKLSGGSNKLFLVGMGGIGKSEIARMYIKQHQADYDVILWVSFADSLEQTLVNDYAFPIQGLSRSEYPEDTDQDYFQRKLRILKEISDPRILIVLDNFDVTEDPRLEEFCGGPYAVIFTTRFHQDSRHFPEVEIREMTEESDLLELFRAEYTRGLDEAALVHVKEILRQLNGHTLSIRLVASAMQHRRIQPEKMVQLLRGGAVEMSRQNTRAADMIFGQLKEVFRLSTLSEDEQYLLKNLALIPLRGIEVETLFDWCGAEDFDVIDELVKKSWVIHNPATDEVHLHPLVADLCQEKLAEDPDCCTRLLTVLLDVVEQAPNSGHEWKLRLLDVVTTACGRMPAGHPMRWRALQAWAQISFSTDRYQKAIEICTELKTIARKLEEKLYVYNKLAHIAVLTGDPEKCREIAQEGYAVVEPLPLDTFNMDAGYLYIELLHRLVESNRALGDYETAVFYGRKAAGLEGRFYNALALTKEGTWGWSEYHLALALYMGGELEEAEARIRHAIDLFQGTGDQWSASFSYDVLGQVQMKKGQFEEALKLNRQCQDILRPMVGEKHRNIATALESRGDIYRAMGDAENAADCYAKAASIYHELNLTKREENALAALRAVQA